MVTCKEIKERKLSAPNVDLFSSNSKALAIDAIKEILSDNLSSGEVIDRICSLYEDGKIVEETDFGNKIIYFISELEHDLNFQCDAEKVADQYLTDDECLDMIVDCFFEIGNGIGQRQERR